MKTSENSLRTKKVRTKGIYPRPVRSFVRVSSDGFCHRALRSGLTPLFGQTMAATAARVCIKSQVIDFPRSARLSRIKHVAKSICGGRTWARHFLRIHFFPCQSLGNTFICYVKNLESGVTPLNVQFDVRRRGPASGIPRPSELRSHRCSGRAFHAYFEKLEC